MRRVGLILAIGTFSLASALGSGASKESHVWTGYVTDTHCGTHCQVTSHMTPDLKCIRLCVKKGSKYGLWSGRRVYVLEPQAKAAAFAARQVRVTGTIEHGTIYMRRIELTSDASASAVRH
jgi:hypothetical protein